MATATATATANVTETTCPYCGVGCGVTAQVSENQAVRIQGSASHPANTGKLCVKGTNLADTLGAAGRLTQPQVNGSAATWTQATDVVADTFTKVVAEHGPQAVAFYLSGQLLTEDYYVANKLMKGFIGSANVDTNSRLCMASAVAGYKRAFGEDVVPCNYEDIDCCDLVILTGSNAAWAHPVLYQRLVAAKQRRGTTVVVIDPRKTRTCEIADLHLAIRPGADAALFNGLLTHLAKNLCLDAHYLHSHTENFEEALAVASLEPIQVAQATGLELTDIEQFFELFARHEKTVTLYSQGINQSSSGTDKANAIINCHLATGRIGESGQGPFSITGQPNAMGGREVGGMANQLAAHMDFDAEHIDRVRRFWQAPNVVDGPGLKAVDMFEALLTGELKAIWIMGTNPAVSLPDSNRVKRGLANCPFVVVSDCVRETDTNVFADVLLPAQGWSEKDGTVTNSERCISRQRRFVEPHGEARPDWEIISTVARKMGFAQAFSYKSAAQVFAEHANLSGFENKGERLFDLSALAGLDAAGYEGLQPTYWPIGKRPFQDGRFSTPNGKARFVASAVRAPEQRRSQDYPLILNTGRIRDQWHTMTRTGRAEKLFGHTFAPALQINPMDARARHLENGDLVKVENQLGCVHLLAEVTEDTPRGLLFAPIHWNDQFAFRSNVSQLVAPVVDPVSGQPESKHAAVRCERIEVKNWVRFASKCRVEPESLNALRELSYWAGAPTAGGWQYEIALQDISGLLNLLPCDALVEYNDSHGGVRVLGRKGKEPDWLLFSDKTRVGLPAMTHVTAQLQSKELAHDLAWRSLSPFAPSGADVSTVVCTCFGVRENSIRQQIESRQVHGTSIGQSVTMRH